MAMKYHPDVNPSPTAKQKFTEVLEAYEYLTGIRKARSKRQGDFSKSEEEKFNDLMRKMAEEKAKAKYRERVRQFRKQREEQQNKEYQKAFYLLVAILILSFSGWQGYKFYFNLKIKGNAVHTEAEVVGIAHKRVIYNFRVGDELIQDRAYVSSHKITMLADNGMPLAIGDRFELVYNSEDYEFHKINYEKVSPETMRRYLSLCAEELKEIYNREWSDLDISDQNIRALCMSLLIFKQYGFDGLGSIVFYDANVLDNFSNNSLSWYFMKDDAEFLEIYHSCEVNPLFDSP